jgi:tetratricopeptide (TPR) repeat protein
MSPTQRALHLPQMAQHAQLEDPSDLRSLIDIAIMLRDCRYEKESEYILSHILSRDSNYAFALFELAILNAMRGEHVNALVCLERILDKSPDDERTLRFAARMNSRIGDHTSARDLVRRVDEVAPDHPDIPWLRELIVFMEKFPAGVADKLTQAYERANRYVNADTVIGWADHSLRNKEGFSLLRLGDGEGAFCCISSEDEITYPNLYKYCRIDRSNVWFDGEIDIDRSGFTHTAFGLRDAVRNANVVGIPYRSWVAHEYKFCSPTGIVCLVNALRLGRLPTISRSQSWTAQNIHLDFIRGRALERLMRSKKRIHLISCLEEAPEILKRHFELDDVILHRIPGEKAHSSQLGKATALGIHYPDRFSELIRSLESPLHGELFLVAGGLLGKIYCNRIKLSGGVALDIGSAVDAWLGKKTRPHISEDLHISS